MAENERNGGKCQRWLSSMQLAWRGWQSWRNGPLGHHRPSSCGYISQHRVRACLSPESEMKSDAAGSYKHGCRRRPAASQRTSSQRRFGETPDGSGCQPHESGAAAGGGSKKEMPLLSKAGLCNLTAWLAWRKKGQPGCCVACVVRERKHVWQLSLASSWRAGLLCLRLASSGA